MAATGLTTYLWFDDQALEAATFYVGLFPQSKLGDVSYYQADAQRDRKSTRLNSSHVSESRMPSSA